MSSAQNHKNILSKKNPNKFKEIPHFMEIKAKNSCHLFEIFFEISNKVKYDESLWPNELFDSSVKNVLAINLRLKNKNTKFYNSNNEQILLNEYYQDLYTLDELKNNYKGFEFFTDLTEFKKAFIDAIKKNRFELLIIKNILLLNVNIINYFNDIKELSVIIRPYIGKKSPEELWNSSNNKNDNSINNNIPLKVPLQKKAKDSSINIINHNLLENNSFINKKRLRNRETPSKNNTSSNSDSNSYTYSNTENEKTQSEITDIPINITKNDLPEFEYDSLARESDIINLLDEEVLIGDAISNSPQKKYRLIYKASRDGDSANKFHYMCDKYSNLIILIKTNKGSRFGGFTSSKFRSTSHLKFDNNAFLFSLDLMKVFNILPGNYAIYCYDNTGPCFSKGSLYVPNSFFTKYGKTRIAGGPFQFKKDYELNNGKEKFLIKELEVFQVKINETPF